METYMPVYLTIEEISEHLHISVGTASNRIAQGMKMPPSVKIGKRRLFPEKQFEAWMESQLQSHEEIQPKHRSAGGRIKR